jgi:hypothetical protein
MPKTDLEKESLIALVMKYEGCYEEIVEYIERANSDKNIGVMQMYGEVVDRLARTFDPEGVQSCLKKVKPS